MMKKIDEILEGVLKTVIPEDQQKRAWEAVENEGGFVPEWARNKYLTKEKVL